MRYETPELTALTPAINAIQTSGKNGGSNVDSPLIHNEGTGAYADWE